MRIGFFGAGFIADFHLDMLAGCGEPFAFGPVFDPDRSRAQAFADRSGATVAADPGEVIDGSDAVFVCTPTSTHGAIVDAVCDAGLPLFCEKPLGVDLAAARSLVDRVRAAGVVNQVGLVLRASPAYALVESLVSDTATAGRLLSITLRDDQHLPTQGRYRSTWRADRAQAGSGVLLEHSIHDLDLLERLGGRISGVTARSRHVHGLDGIEDVVAATYDMASPAIATLTTVWHDVLSRPGERLMEVHCERAFGSVVGDWFGPVRWVTSDDDTSWTGGEVYEECERRGCLPSNPAAQFLRAAREGRPSAPDVDVALRAHELVDATYRSAAAGALPVAVDPPTTG